MRNKKNIRTCLGCYIKKEKQEMYRIANIKNKDKDANSNDNTNKRTNNIIFDKDQTFGGRGVYVCSIACLDKSLERNFLQKRIKRNIKSDKIEEIKEEITNVINEELARKK